MSLLYNKGVTLSQYFTDIYIKNLKKYIVSDIFNIDFATFNTKMSEYVKILNKEAIYL